MVQGKEGSKDASEEPEDEEQNKAIDGEIPQDDRNANNSNDEKEEEDDGPRGTETEGQTDQDKRNKDWSPLDYFALKFWDLEFFLDFNFKFLFPVLSPNYVSPLLAGGNGIIKLTTKATTGIILVD